MGIASNSQSHDEFKPHPQTWKAVISSSIGNALEWYDVLIYGAMAVIIAKLFFPVENQTVSLLITFATFGVSFFMRPLGAIVIGIYSDRVGRKAALTLSIFLMMLGTLLIAIMPTYSQIGLWAPLGIVLARLIQGFSAGGEFGSSTTYLVEHAPHRRGFFASWQVASQGLSIVFAAIAGTMIYSLLTEEQLYSWGWRLPFMFGLLIGPVGYYIRRTLDESPEFAESEPTQHPLRLCCDGNSIGLSRGIYADLCSKTTGDEFYLIICRNNFSGLYYDGFIAIYWALFR